jgi:hypothetical protein
MTKTQSTVNEVLSHNEAANSVLRRHGIALNSRISLNDAARAANIVPDELCAMLEVQMRRAARREVSHMYGFQHER